jgi:hypothetical protein
MDVTASLDRLIASLQTFKAAIPSYEHSNTMSSFDALFADASSKLEQFSTGTGLPLDKDVISMLAPSTLNAATFAQLTCSPETSAL